MSIKKYVMIFSMMKNIDPTNKEYFTESHPVARYALGMVLCMVYSVGVFVGIDDNIGVIYFLVCLMSALWCSYRFIILLSYKRAPKNSPSRLQWLEARKRKSETLSELYDSILAPIVTPLIKLIGYLALGVLFIGGCLFLSSVSVHSLLIIIIVLILIK